MQEIKCELKILYSVKLTFRDKATHRCQQTKTEGLLFQWILPKESTREWASDKQND